MDIETLVEALSADVGGVLTSTCREGDVYVLIIECELPRGRPRRFRLECMDVVEVDIAPGIFEEIDHATDHPLLLEHVDAQAELYFSSSPTSAGDVFLAAYEAIDGIFHGSRDPQRMLCHRPSEFASVLARGHGMLARGPGVVMDALAKRLDGMLQVYSRPTRNRGGKRAIVRCDAGFVICASISVTEIPA
jgi:hypothetical protein